MMYFTFWKHCRPSAGTQVWRSLTIVVLKNHIRIEKQCNLNHAEAPCGTPATVFTADTCLRNGPEIDKIAD